MHVLETRSLSKRYTRTGPLAVDDISLTVDAGEVLAVVGESGCGKTTLLRLIAGLEVPTAGEVLLNGYVASTPAAAAPPEKRGIGLVFQEYALFPHLTVLDNVTFGLLSLHRTKRRTRALETLALVGLDEYAHRFPHELSGGQQQRVALARALAPQPSLLLLDEPFSNLDVVLKLQVREEVAHILRTTRTTALFVVHDLEDVLSSADRIAILKQGRLQQIDTPEAIYREPSDAYVAQLFGRTNLLPASVRGDGFDTPLGYVSSGAARGRRGSVTLSLQPQDLELTEADDGGAAATVEEVRFRGDFMELVVRLTGDGRPALRLHARAVRQLHAGELVYVRLRPGTIRVLGPA